MTNKAEASKVKQDKIHRDKVLRDRVQNLKVRKDKVTEMRAQAAHKVLPMQSVIMWRRTQIWRGSWTICLR